MPDFKTKKVISIILSFKGILETEGFGITISRMVPNYHLLKNIIPESLLNCGLIFFHVVHAPKWIPLKLLTLAEEPEIIAF